MLNIKIKHDIQIGEVYGDMQIIEYRGRTKNGNKKYLVKCVMCGYEKSMKDSHIKAHNGTTHGRGCDKEKTKIKIGKIYGDMEVLKCIGRTDKSNNKSYLVRCVVCGEERIIKDSAIRSNKGTDHGRSCIHHSRKKNPLKVGDIVVAPTFDSHSQKEVVREARVVSIEYYNDGDNIVLPGKSIISVEKKSSKKQTKKRSSQCASRAGMNWT